MDDGLRPREIQARIRAGQSSAQIAEATGMPIEKVARFEAPVLAERAHIVDRARATEARRYDGATFGDIVDAALKEQGVDLQTAAWDSWRGDDGIWTVSVSFEGHTALFTYDIVARAVLAASPAARELLDPADAAPVLDERPHLVSVPSVGPNEVYDLDRDLASSEPTVIVPLASVDILANVDIEEEGIEEENVLELIHEPIEQTEQNFEPTPPRPSKPAKGKRASVPSWDEILFGGSDDSL